MFGMWSTAANSCSKNTGSKISSVTNIAPIGKASMRHQHSSRLPSNRRRCVKALASMIPVTGYQPSVHANPQFNTQPWSVSPTIPVPVGYPQGLSSQPNLQLPPSQFTPQIIHQPMSHAHNQPISQSYPHPNFQPPLSRVYNLPSPLSPPQRLTSPGAFNPLLEQSPVAPRIEFNPPLSSTVGNNPSVLPSTTPLIAKNPPPPGMLEVPVNVDRAELVKGADGNFYCRMRVKAGLQYNGPNGPSELFESHVVKTTKLQPNTFLNSLLRTPDMYQPPQQSVRYVKEIPEPSDSREWKAKPQKRPLEIENSAPFPKPNYNANPPTPLPPSEPPITICLVPPPPEAPLQRHENFDDESSWAIPAIIGAALVGGTAVAVTVILTTKSSTVLTAASPVNASPPVATDAGLLCHHGNYKKRCGICMEPPAEIEFRLPVSYFS